MKTPTWFATLAFGALLSLEAWTLNAVIDLKVTVATLATRLDNTKHLASTP